MELRVRIPANRDWWGKARLNAVMSLARILNVPIDVRGSYFYRPAAAIASPSACPNPCQSIGLAPHTPSG